MAKTAPDAAFRAGAALAVFGMKSFSDLPDAGLMQVTGLAK
jgi:hypothetical protein